MTREKQSEHFSFQYNIALKCILVVVAVVVVRSRTGPGAGGDATTSQSVRGAAHLHAAKLIPAQSTTL